MSKEQKQYWEPRRAINITDRGAEAWQQAGRVIKTDATAQAEFDKEVGLLGKQMVEDLKGLLPKYREVHTAGSGTVHGSHGLNDWAAMAGFSPQDGKGGTKYPSTSRAIGNTFNQPWNPPQPTPISPVTGEGTGGQGPTLASPEESAGEPFFVPGTGQVLNYEGGPDTGQFLQPGTDNPMQGVTISPPGTTVFPTDPTTPPPLNLNSGMTAGQAANGFWSAPVANTANAVWNGIQQAAGVLGSLPTVASSALGLEASQTPVP